ncbi:nitrite reductase small subunit NirD [Vibrio porteresiae]|uniref:Nitrite reductase small subunit NirD n=1 Tax=Vibrio porteresiae DSM 19223 TaxID=1123496 RepID=A0ABZ0QLY9_9VIBR|nr:nitrite reductase small subunit NirD [Vibrio porteresiae]WPC76505.1 nitrite reductase small subunit NirD [Vibrio porteresiae DSM 19223]
MSQWQTICKISDIAPNSGVCAKVGDKQVAIFFSQRTNHFYAIGNYDPIGKANVLSRGIIGSIDNELYVASPLYKQHWNLATGACLEKPELSIATYEVQQANDEIQIRI